MKYNPQILPNTYQAVFKNKFSRQELEKYIIKEIKANPQLQAFMDQYNDPNQNAFIGEYASIKTDIILNIDGLRDKVQGIYTVFMKYASDRIWDIQQKKLFDIQCQWRAEQLTIPDVKCTWDFVLWSHQIKLCNFLTPISGSEVELYISFLKSSSEDLTQYFPEWQSYDGFKENYKDVDEGEDMPAWFQYHNDHTGNGALLSLPNIRGDKEGFYQELWWDNQGKIHDRPLPEKPDLSYYDDTSRNAFIDQFETKQFAKQFKEYHHLKDLIESTEETEEAIHFLLRWHEEIPIKANTDWRRAVIEAKHLFINKKIAEAMVTVYDEYKMRLDLNLPHEDKIDNSYKMLIERLSEGILKGRQLNGEPPDFNF